MFSQISQSAESRITKREGEILDLAYLTYAGIGERLGIAEGTVRRHMERIRLKLGAESTRHALVLWSKHTNSLRYGPASETASAAPAQLRRSA